MSIPLRAAESIIDELAINDVKDLRLLKELAFQRQAIIQYKQLKTAEARLIVGQPYSVIVISTAISDSRRRRFSIAHELGHLELHKYRVAFPCDSESISNWPSEEIQQDLEQEANEFAAALLLPERFFAPLCWETEPSLDAVQRLAEEFDVSLMATAIRYVRYCYEPVAVVWTQKQQIKWFQRNEAFADYGLFINIHSMIDEDTMTARYFTGEGLPTSPEPVEASIWMAPGRFDEILIQEHCVAMPNYDGVLTLLWVDEDWLYD